MKLPSLSGSARSGRRRAATWGKSNAMTRFRCFPAVQELILTGLLIGPFLGHAQTPVTTESFAYTGGGTIAGASGGTGWAQSWQGGHLTIGTGGLAFPAREGGGLAGIASGNDVDYAASDGKQNYSTRQMTTSVDLSKNGVYYASVLLRKSASGGSDPDTDQIAVKFFTGSTQRWGFGLNSEENFFVECGPDNPTWTAAALDVALNTTYFLVSKLETSAAGYDQWFLSVYGPSNTVPLAEPVSWQLSFSGSSAATGVDLVRLEYGTYAQGAIDEFRFGSSWSAVTTAIPEPATYATLAGLTALAVAAWRRRQHLFPTS
ncbi:MAG: hypothetical protein PHQ04_00230 [Opitutaceae bacterium]|nr:hypothetical protein [Opitutaceae bacterium]